MGEFAGDSTASDTREDTMGPIRNTNGAHPREVVVTRLDDGQVEIRHLARSTEGDYRVTLTAHDAMVLAWRLARTALDDD